MVTKLWDSPEIYGIDVPMPNNPLRNLNAYVIRTPERSLVVDTGFNRPECRDALWAGIRKLELDHAKTVLFLTHYHSDHIGLVWDFVEQGVPVYMGHVEHGYYEMLQSDGLREMGERFLEEGFPREQLARQSSENQGRQYAPRPGFPVKEVEDGARLDLGGVEIQAIHTPGHTVDHICTRTPDNVLYLGDAMMTGRTLHHSKFPFAFCVRDYLDSMRKMRTEPADKFIVAHYGIYDEILPLVDMEARFFAERMVDLLDLVDGPTTPAKMAADICRTYHIDAGDLRNLSYFATSSLSYINYLRGLGYLEAYIEDNQIFYRRTPASYERKEQKSQSVLPKTGQFR